MYNEENNKVNFFVVLLRVLLFVLIFILAIKLITFLFNRGKVNNKEDVMTANLNMFKDAGIKVVKDDSFNLKVGEVKSYKLKELIENKQVNEIKDENNNNCSDEESYIEITKTETEYRIKTYLSCDNIKKDKYTYLDVKTKEELSNQGNTTTEPITTKEPTTTTAVTTTKPVTTTTKKTTKKVVTSTKKVTTTQATRTTTTIPNNKVKISFNTNGGNQLNTIIADKGTIIQLPTPTRTGYTFYRWEDSKGNVFGNNIKADQNYVLVAKWR